jgi:hypothetical protein
MKTAENTPFDRRRRPQAGSAIVTAVRRLGTLRHYAALLGVVLLAVISAHSAVWALRETRRTFKAGTPDFAVAYRQKVIRVKALLPERGTVGYLSDYSDEGEFYLTQYLLVPLILKKGAAADLVLVNNHVASKTGRPDDAGYSTSEQKDGSTVYDFGNGVYLIDRRPKP